MPPPLRRWRPLIAIAALWLFVCYYFLWNTSDLATGSGAPAGLAPFKPKPFKRPHKNDGKTHWSRLPEQFPVTSLRALPTGRPTPHIPNVQRRPPPEEDSAARKTREQRLAAVKESFLHSWAGYKKNAWLSDEVAPLSGDKKDPFGGWAATLVDALDTLWIMGLKDEFHEAVRACEEIDFTTTEEMSVNVFETTIRYLGGFLAAFELSGMQYPTLLNKAVEVAEFVMCAFDTPNRMPISRWNWRDYLRGEPQSSPRTVLVSEIGSLSLEFTKLSQLTGEMKYYDAVQRIADHFEKEQKNTKLPGMWPVVVDSVGMKFDTDNSFTLGGMSDSLFEYFPKQYLMLGGALEQPRKLYEGFIDVAKKHLFRRALNAEDIPIVFSGDARVTGSREEAEVTTAARGQHLTCFAGGMVGLGARIFSREDEVDLAIQMTDACVWAYNVTASGIGPEIFAFVPCGLIGDSQTGEKCAFSEEKWHAAVRKYWRPHSKADETEAEVEEYIRSTIKNKRLPPGLVDMPDSRYILRPEAIESVFIMHRITGDPTWMDKAWQMFMHIEMHTRTTIAAASLSDVNRAKPSQVDSMESFWLAETLKYFFLVFAPWDVVDLDEWVLNTEAHPLKRPAPVGRPQGKGTSRRPPPNRIPGSSSNETTQKKRRLSGDNSDTGVTRTTTPTNLPTPPNRDPRSNWPGTMDRALAGLNLSTITSLKQFIRNVRAAKTIADERAVIQKESAAIRASFREESGDHAVRRNNVAKLLYLFTLGERTHFGQIECLKLLASPHFADKRLGHLATSLLLDENQEVLTLVTNSLKNDLSHSNQYVVGLALCTLGNIASVEMSRDLFPEIENLVSTANPYIRRKAALCAMRICRKVPDLQEHFIERAAQLLSDRNHGVLLCGLTLVTSLCEADEEEGGEEGIVEKFRQFVPGLVRTLKGLASSGYAPEHDVTGITDPFLQVKILRLLRVLARGDAHTTEQINDILAQVATNTDSTKNVGNSILYEAVLTILDIEADSGLRVLGVNILGKFLSNRDNNIRYVALNTLVKVVAIDTNAVQRHRNTILECLRDPDISIRRRALDLSFTLINESNVRVLIRELLAFLEVADNEFKPTMTSQIGIAADRYAPNKRWHVDTMLRVLTLAGNYVKEPILSSFIRLVATSPELQTYAVQKLYTNLKKDITQESLTQAGAWCIGEYGDALLQGGQYEEEELVSEVKENEIIDLFTTILNSAYATQVTTEYIVTALIKLTTRLSEPAQIDRVRRLLANHNASLDVEVQQRAVEYGNLFAYEQIRRGVLEKMPPPQIKEESRVLGEATKKTTKAANRKSKVIKPKEEDLLFDLMGDNNVPSAAPVNGGQNNADLLADILGGTSSPPPAAASPTSQSSNMASIMDLFGPGSGPAASPAPAPAPAAAASNLDLFGSTAPPAPQPQAQAAGAAAPAGHPCYNNHGLNITIQTQRNAEGIVQAVARFRNASAGPLKNVGLQAAVPKSQKLQLLSISSSDIASGSEATQMMRVTGAKGPLRLRLRIQFASPSAGEVTDQVNWSEPS
ncbi:hypothetical protein GQ53DRAFT_808170 [Thozetella sp. PMI_491]|nr:hypothetical protein GQ53DRAFT_808170 [Thozetella sp. PMI_491]